MNGAIAKIELKIHCGEKEKRKKIEKRMNLLKKIEKKGDWKAKRRKYVWRRKEKKGWEWRKKRRRKTEEAHTKSK